MGEVRVGGYFAEAVLERGHEIVVSAMTETGYQLCAEVYPSGTPRFRVPFDLPGPMRQVFEHFNPRALVLVETEWWPNFLTEAARLEVPVFIVNGRLSERAFRRYRMGAAYWRSLLRAVRFFFMRTHEEAERVKALGVDAWRVRAAGSLKVPALCRDEAHWAGLDARDEGDRFPIWIAGCVRPGEEKIILKAYQSLLPEFPDLKLWMAPRHPERFNKVHRLIRRAGFEVTRWSESEPGNGELRDTPVILIDRMGILASLYAKASIAFMGGSLRPYGGHNPLEPALAGVPVVFGPHMEEQRDAAELLVGIGMATEVTDAQSLSTAIANTLQSLERADVRQNRASDLRLRLLGIREEVADDMFSLLEAIDGTSGAESTPSLRQEAED
jgi:3-deoxy-D-manno-octulosonic-acid transferase